MCGAIVLGGGCGFCGYPRRIRSQPFQRMFATAQWAAQSVSLSVWGGSERRQCCCFRARPRPGRLIAARWNRGERTWLPQGGMSP